MYVRGEFNYRTTGQPEAFLRFEEDDESFLLDLVFVPSAARGAGIGSLLVSRLLLLADSVGKPIRLMARPLGRTAPDTVERLVAYYRRFGFVEGEKLLAAVRMTRPVGAGPADGTN